jgi:hypothetical protein
MNTKPCFPHPDVIIVDNDPTYVDYITNIVTDVLGVTAATFTEKRSALEWCAGHPVHTDLVITREGEEPFNGFKLLRQLDEIFLRPVYAILLINPRGNDYSAECWFDQLDKVFKTIKPLKAICWPYRKYKLGTALDKAFPWYKPDMQCAKMTEENKSREGEKR